MCDNEKLAQVQKVKTTKGISYKDTTKKVTQDTLITEQLGKSRGIKCKRCEKLKKKRDKKPAELLMQIFKTSHSSDNPERVMLRRGGSLKKSKFLRLKGKAQVTCWT